MKDWFISEYFDLSEDMGYIHLLSFLKSNIREVTKINISLIFWGDSIVY